VKYIAKKKKKLKKMIKKKINLKVNPKQMNPKQIENISKKLVRLEIKFNKSFGNLEKIGETVRSLIPEARMIKSVQSDLNKTWNYSHYLAQRIDDVKSRMNSISRKNTQTLLVWEEEVKTTHEMMKKFEDNLKNVMKLPEFYKDVNEKVGELEKQYNHIASDAMAKIKELEDTIKPEEEKMHKIVDLDVVKDQVEGIRTSMLTFNKLWDDYKRTIDERLGLRPSAQTTTVSTGWIASKLEEEVKSLRDMVNQLSLENDQIKKLTRDIKVTQLGTPSTEIVADLMSRINTVEKKMIEVEQEMSKSVKDKPIIME
jgi:DNA repair exonuclease SbcCD ATPase subunit